MVVKKLKEGERDLREPRAESRRLRERMFQTPAV